MLAKPTSLPPTVRLTRVVLALSAPSCVLTTLAVVAPEQATERYDAGRTLAAYSAGYALVLRWQEPLSVV